MKCMYGKTLTLLLAVFTAAEPAAARTLYLRSELHDPDRASAAMELLQCLAAEHGWEWEFSEAIHTPRLEFSPSSELRLVRSFGEDRRFVWSEANATALLCAAIAEALEDKNLPTRAAPPEIQPQAPLEAPAPQSRASITGALPWIAGAAALAATFFLLKPKAGAPRAPTVIVE